MQCKNCKWYGNTMLYAQFGSPATPAGRCHINPPTDKGFPIVSEKGFCGKFEGKVDS